MKKFYLTKQGLENLKKNYEILKELRRIKIQGGVPEILESEDLNPEYLSYSEDINLLDSKLFELKNILENTEIIKKPSLEKQNIIDFGATVVVGIDGQEDEFMIVDPLESNPSLGKISSESPVGKALLGHKVGDEVIISSPIKIVYRIKKVKYDSL